MTENSLCLSLNSSANASNLNLHTTLSFGRVEKLLEKKKLLVTRQVHLAVSHYFSSSSVFYPYFVPYTPCFSTKGYKTPKLKFHWEHWHSTLEGFGFKIARPIDDGRLWKSSERKKENAVKQQFSFLAHLSTTCSRGAFRVVMCPSSVFRRASLTISLNIFSSQTVGPIWTKLGRNISWEVLFKTCSQNLIPSKTLVAMATKLNFLSISLKFFSSGTTGPILK